MDKIRIRGGRPLTGSIAIGGAKNAALPLMAASLLTGDTLRLSNLPHVADITTLASLLRQLGVRLTLDGEAGNGGHAGRVLALDAGDIVYTTARYDLVRRMRASVLVLGPLLARCGRARVSLPGGCAIGNRPVDLHLKGLAQLGAEIDLVDGYIDAKAKGRLRGAAASLADGVTVLSNAAREPEVCDLARCLVAMGARIDGIGSDELTVTGVEALHGADYAVVFDRIEAGTYAAAAAVSDGDVELVGAQMDLLGVVGEKFGEAGVVLEPTEKGVRVRRENATVSGADIMTQPYPGFPTDLQAQMMAMMATAQGAAMISETIFENRFMHVPELTRMGADITVHGASALVRGVPRLIGAPVMATDLRASVSLVLAGLAAEGDTIIDRVYHLDRGYERIEEKLAACGAEIERFST